MWISPSLVIQTPYGPDEVDTGSKESIYIDPQIPAPKSIFRIDSLLFVSY